MLLRISILCIFLFLALGTKSQQAIANPETLNMETFSITDSELNITTETGNSPLVDKLFQLSTAKHLRQGEFVIDIRNRLYFPSGSVAEVGTTTYLNFGFIWGITDNLELSLESQRVDTAFPVTQGEFLGTRNPTGQNFFLSDQELTLELKQRIWRNPSQTQSLSGVLSLSVGDRGFRFVRDNLVSEGIRSGVVPALQLPFTASLGDRLQLTFSPTVAFFGEENALHIHRLPIENPGSFGTTFGFGGAISYSLSPRFILWGDAFIPVTGNNSISRESGLPAKTVAFNVGLRYLLNPQLALDVFASNTQGSKAPLSLTADREAIALGVGVSVMPDFIAANRRYKEAFGTEKEESGSFKVSSDGLAFFDGGTLPSGKFLFNLQGGTQGILTALRFGLLDDFEFGVYLDYIFGEVDESEQGFSTKIRLLKQGENAPITVSLAATLGLTNEPFVNFITNNKNEFNRRNLEKSVPYFFQADNDFEGRRYIFTFALPLDYQFNNGAALWFTPILGYAQRLGTEIAGFNVGGSVPIGRDFSFVGEIGANFIGNGNAFIGNNRENVIPWAVAFRWNPSSVFGIDPTKTKINPFLELYLTNRVGSSTWHELRVRDQNDLAVGVGLSIPF